MKEKDLYFVCNEKTRKSLNLLEKIGIITNPHNPHVYRVENATFIFSSPFLRLHFMSVENI